MVPFIAKVVGRGGGGDRADGRRRHAFATSTVCTVVREGTGGRDMDAMLPLALLADGQAVRRAMSTGGGKDLGLDWMTPLDSE